MPALIDVTERRVALVAAAWRIGASDGLNAVTVRRVASHTKLSVSAVQRAFPTHEALHRLLAQELLGRNRGTIRAALNEHSGVDRLIALLPRSEPRRAEYVLSERMRHGGHLFAGYPDVARRCREDTRAVREAEFRRHRARPSTKRDRSAHSTELIRFNVVFDGLAASMLDESIREEDQPNPLQMREMLRSALHPASR